MIKKILQSDWMRALWPITCKVKITQTWNLHLESDNCNVFHFELLPAKTNAKIFLKLKITSFWVLFAHFKVNQIFSEKFDPLIFSATEFKKKTSYICM